MLFQRLPNEQAASSVACPARGRFDDLFWHDTHLIESAGAPTAIPFGWCEYAVAVKKNAARASARLHGRDKELRHHHSPFGAAAAQRVPAAQAAAG
jgi:hypothetical protein